ncbi:hypothetical protein L484_014106 [Morus notabilis]|uniref:AT-hook motif nuclear-localized protein n=1 Tax=Morus notabilis TaxID=981085 RepID=W9RMH4_9ROSA|nr:hypothetical protein L484_014106 [Morus notabilis]
MELTLINGMKYLFYTISITSSFLEGGIVVDTAGGSLTPHVIIAQTGEDVVGKIISFSEKGPRAVCVISATGVVSNVTIRQPSGGFLRFEA